MRQLLIQAEDEIVRLRRQNEILSAKCAVVDAFTLALHAEPPRAGYAEDIAWKIRQAIAKMESDLMPESEN